MRPLLAALLLCAAASAADPAKEEITLALQQEPYSLDGLMASMAAATEITECLGHGMVNYDENWKKVPAIVEEVPTFKNGLWKLEQGGRMTVTWRLREGVKWSDGRPVSAKDFAFAFRLIMDERVKEIVSRDRERRIEAIEAPDDRTVVVKWKEPYAYADGGHSYLPEHVVGPIYEKDPENYNKNSPFHKNPIGEGPFMLEKWERDSYLSLVRNPHFYGPPPNIRRIIFKFVRDSNTILANLESGEADGVASVGLTLNQAVELGQRKDLPFQVHMTPGLTWEHIDVNLDSPILKDRRVRQALLYGADREKMVKALFGGRQEVAHTWLPPKHYASNGEAKRYPFDPDKARALLEEAGWRRGPGGIRVNGAGERLCLVIQTTTGNEDRKKVELILQQQWEEIGVELKIENQDASAFFGETVQKRRFPHLAMYAWMFGPEADGEDMWRSDRIPSEKNGWEGANNPGWVNEEATQIHRKVPVTLDEAERRRLLLRQQEIWTEELPSLPLYFRLDPSAVHRDLQGWAPRGFGTMTWNCEGWGWRK